MVLFLHIVKTKFYTMNIKYALMPLIGSALLLLSCQNAKTDSNQETTDLETVNKNSLKHYDLLLGSS